MNYFGYGDTEDLKDFEQCYTREQKIAEMKVFGRSNSAPILSVTEESKLGKIQGVRKLILFSLVFDDNFFTLLN